MRFHKEYPNSCLQLIGDGALRSEIEKLVAENDLMDNVQFLGLQDNVYGYLQQADIFTLPSTVEGMPITLIEAMGTGLPIVATRVGGIPDMLTDGEDALLTDVDSEQIAKAWMKLAEDKELRERLGKNALRRSVQYSAETMAEKYLEVFQS